MRDLISKGLLTAAAASSVLSMGGGYAQAADANGAAVGSPGLLSGNNVQVPLDIPVNVCGNTVDPVGVLNPAFGNTCANVSKPPEHHAPQQHHTPQQHHGPHGQDTPQEHHAPPQYGAPGAPHQAVTGSGSEASSIAQGSPGVLGGNSVEAPVDVPVNVCGNSADLAGVLNPVFGNTCANGAPPAHPERPAAPEGPETPDETPDEAPEDSTPPESRSGRPSSPAGPPHHEPGAEGAHAVTSAMLFAPRSAAPPAAGDPQLAATGGDPRLLGAAAASAGLILGGALLYRRTRVPARV
ncbi:chaplin [Streptomyces sp. NPDC088124]|uniref:chaplin n=1 Tax=Streptomyces sp. NPDC088124 TaxID=3154654 RepID=UPI0034487868